MRFCEDETEFGESVKTKWRTECTPSVTVCLMLLHADIYERSRPSQVKPSATLERLKIKD